MDTVAVAILNFNGSLHLPVLLPTLAEAVRHCAQPCDVIVLDNSGYTEEHEWIRKQFPWVLLEVSPTNDYLFSYNRLLQSLPHDVVVLLNNDTRVHPEFLLPLLHHMANEDVFAVSASCHDWDGNAAQNGPALLKFHRGWAFVVYDTSIQVPSYTLFPTGACAAISRRKFNLLGGFDRLYYPAYGEDLDLGYRAWASGWKCVFEPRSVIFHRESASFGNAARYHIIRTSFLFQWRNFTHAGLRLRRAFYTYYMRSVLMRHDPVWRAAYQQARIDWAQRRHLAAKMRPPRVDLARLCSILGQPVVA